MRWKQKKAFTHVKSRNDRVVTCQLTMRSQGTLPPLAKWPRVLPRWRTFFTVVLFVSLLFLPSLHFTLLLHLRLITSINHAHPLTHSLTHSSLSQQHELLWAMTDPNSPTSDIHYYDNNDSTGEWDNNNSNQSSTSALYPPIPPLPLPLSSKYSHTFQPSAPPSALPSTLPSAPPPTSSPWTSAPVCPSTDSHSYSPTAYTLSYPVDYATNHQAEDYTAYDSATNPWHAPSHSPAKEDLQ